MSTFVNTFPQHLQIYSFTAILKQTKREWRKRKEILQSMLDECAREIPLSELEQLTQDQHSASSQAPRERSYDVDKLYAQYEDELNKARRRAIGPEAYGMLETDVNLRKYRIIGGVYCIDFLETPQQDKQLNARSFIRTGNSAIRVISGGVIASELILFPSQFPPPTVWCTRSTIKHTSHRHLCCPECGGCPRRSRLRCE